MNKSLHNKFKELQGQFDVHTPDIGHFDKFETLLSKNKTYNFWKPLAIAASLLLLVSFGWSFMFGNSLDLKDVSPKMADTQTYFTSVINQELKELGKVESNDNKKIISDAMAQINLLETDYNKLKVQLKESDENNRIIYAMINNYQKRIAILKTVLNQINNIKQSKNINHENKII